MRKPKGISLHVGLNEVDPDHYGGWSGPLNACEADAEDMEAIAQAKGFTSRVLLTAAATREAVIAGIGDAAKQTEPGDIFLLTYSGHGGQVPDHGGDEDDLQDETWCLFDGQMIDDELYRLWSEFEEGVRILLLSDSCHSGTVAKLVFDPLSGAGGVPTPAARALGLEQVRYRVMPDEVALRTFRRNRSAYRTLGEGLDGEAPPPKASVRLISGCQDNQLSMDGTFNGLFTGTLLRVWNDGGFKGDYNAFHKRIVQFMPSTQTPKHFRVGAPDPAYDAQGPFTI